MWAEKKTIGQLSFLLLAQRDFKGRRRFTEPYPFSVTFWHLKNAEQHVGRFLAHPNVLLKGF